MSSPKVTLSSTCLTLGAIVALPGEAMACGRCADAIAYLALPWLPAIYAVVAGWFLVRMFAVLCFGSGRLPIAVGVNGILIVAGFCFLGLAAFAILGLYFTGGALSFLMLIAIAHDFTVERGKTLYALGVIGLVGIALAIFIGISGATERGQLSDLEAFARYGSVTAGPIDAVSRRLARNPDVSLQDLTLMLQSHDPELQTKAVHILKARDKSSDILALREEVLQITPIRPMSDRPDWGTLERALVEWFDAVTFTTIRNRQDLHDWIQRVEARS